MVETDIHGDEYIAGYSMGEMGYMGNVPKVFQLAFPAMVEIIREAARKQR